MNASRRFVRWLLTCSIMLAGARAARAEPIAWQPDLEQARQLAAQQNRLLLIHFWSPDCVPCLQLERHVFQEDLVAETLNASVVPVKVDASQNPQLAELMGVQSWPTDVLVTPNGQVVGRWQSPQGAKEYVSRFLQGTRTATMQLAAAAQASGQAIESAAAQTRVLGQRMESEAQQMAEQGRRSLDGIQQQAGQWAENVRANMDQVASQVRPWGASAPAPSSPATVANPFVGGDAPTAGQTAAPSGPAAAPPPAQASPPASAAPPWQAPTSSNPSASGQTVPPWDQPEASSTAPGSAIERPQATRPAPQSSPPAQAQSSTAQSSTAQSSTALPSTGSPAQGTSPATGGHQPAPQGPTPWDRHNPAPQDPALAATSPGPAGAAAAPDLAETPGEATSEASPPVGLDGYCPVSLLEENRWQRGDARWGAIHRGRTYLFASQEYQRKFIESPDRYSPVLAGIDPVMLVDHGKVVSGKRAHGVVFDDHVYLFSSEEALRKFWSAPETYAQPIRQAMRTGSIRQMLR